MNTVSKQGINRNYTLTYGAGPNGHAKGAKLTVENERTGATRSLSAFGATNGEQSVGGVHFNGPNVNAGVVGAKGPNGSVVASGFNGPQHAGGRIAVRDANGDLQRLWKGYV